MFDPILPKTFCSTDCDRGQKDSQGVRNQFSICFRASFMLHLHLNAKCKDCSSLQDDFQLNNIFAAYKMCTNSFKQHIILPVSNWKAFYKLMQLQTSKQWPNITHWKSFIHFHQADYRVQLSSHSIVAFYFQNCYRILRNKFQEEISPFLLAFSILYLFFLIDQEKRTRENLSPYDKNTLEQCDLWQSTVWVSSIRKGKNRQTRSDQGLWNWTTEADKVKVLRG